MRLQMSPGVIEPSLPVPRAFYTKETKETKNLIVAGAASACLSRVLRDGHTQPALYANGCRRILPRHILCT